MSLKYYIRERVLEWKWADMLKLLEKSEEQEKMEIARFLNARKLGKLNFYTAFPYPFEDEYRDLYLNTGTSEGYPYVITTEGHRLYASNKSTEESIAQYYATLLKEQDKRSPHCYVPVTEREPRPNSVIIDCGAAEGMFALKYIEKAKRAILLECENGWTEPLKRTFEPWKDKVTIVQKYVGKKNSNKEITLNALFDQYGLKDEKNVFVKADIEGAERDLLYGADGVMQNISQIVLCTYHRKDDERVLKEQLKQAGFQTSFNRGYMIFYYNVDKFVRPYLRKGIIYGKR